MGERFFTLAILLFLIVFIIGVFKNLGNTAFWEDEGETVQLAKSILKYGYPSVFDGRSFFIIEENLYRSDNFARYPSPYLQFYLAAIPLKFTGGVGDTFLIRLPFALIATIGIFLSVILFNQFKLSKYSIFLYSFFVASSVQLYLYYRQARHYALQFSFALIFLYSYLNIDKLAGKISFVLFGNLLYHTFYPGFIGIFTGVLIHFILRQFFDPKSKKIIKSFALCNIILIISITPAFFYLHHYQQVAGSGFVGNLVAYFYDYNYHMFFKIFFLSSLLIFLLTYSRRKNVSFFKSSLKKLFFMNNYLISLFFIITITYPIVLSFGRHNVRYISLLFPLGFLLTSYSLDKMLVLLNKSLKFNLFVLRILSLPIMIFLINLSHPLFFNQIKLFYEELNATYIGPIEVIVNTITNSKQGSIDPYSSLRPNLLIATNQEEGSLYTYLDSHFLSFKASGPYKYGNRLPDWIIPRNTDLSYYYQLFDLSNYEKITTHTCDLDFEQVYNVRTHRFKTPTDCTQFLTLYKLR